MSLIIGIASGFIVDYFAKKRAEDENTYQFLLNYLFAEYSSLDIFIPADLIHHMNRVNRDENSEWKKSMLAIIDSKHPENADEKDYSADDVKLAKTINIAINELQQWKKKLDLMKLLIK